MINLDRHIEILLLSNDCVIVPGFGGFMAHHIDARKDNSDGSFLPPIRSIGFNPKLTLNDSLLAQSYVEAYDISYPDAVMRIEDEVRELRQRIDSEGKYEFTDIGTISLNGDGNYEFTPCEAGIVSPDLYGLGSFGMKTLAEMRAALQATLAETETEADAETEAPTTSKETTKEVKLNSDEHKHYARMVALWRNIAVACIAIILFMLIPSPLVNNSQIAGNHIDTRLLDRVLPKDITTGQDKVSEAVKSEESKKIVEEKASAKEANNRKDADVDNTSESNLKEGYSIVIASHVTLKNAGEYVNRLHRRGFDDAFVHSNGHVKVLLGHYYTREEASKALNSINDKQEFAGAWITNVKF